ncbi:MAG: hypothetical protein RQ824_12915, partial [bacterium]|nr:hypothetical protein [bacterium]
YPDINDNGYISFYNGWVNLYDGVNINVLANDPGVYYVKTQIGNDGSVAWRYSDDGQLNNQEIYVYDGSTTHQITRNNVGDAEFQLNSVHPETLTY